MRMRSATYDIFFAIVCLANTELRRALRHMAPAPRQLLPLFARTYSTIQDT